MTDRLLEQLHKAHSRRNGSRLDLALGAAIERCRDEVPEPLPRVERGLLTLNRGLVLEVG